MWSLLGVSGGWMWSLVGVCGLWWVDVVSSRCVWSLVGGCGLWWVDVVSSRCVWYLVGGCGLHSKAVFCVVLCCNCAEKRLVGMETENKITRKHMKRMRKQLSGKRERKKGRM